MTEKEPKKTKKVKLFAHKGEAVVFWICLAALVFLAITSLFRYFYLDKVAKEYNKRVGEAHPIVLQLNELQAENDSLRQEQISLKQVVSALEDSALQFRSDLSKLKNQKAGQPAPPLTAEPKSKVRVLPDN